MTTSFSGVRLGKAAAALLTLSMSLVVHADQACDAAFNKSSAKASCNLRHTSQYEPGACEITADCKKNIGYGMVTNNVIHRKLDSVKDLSNTDGLLRGGVEATPPKPANETSPMTAVALDAGPCTSAWNRSPAARTCTVKKMLQPEKGVCLIGYECKQRDGKPRLGVGDERYDLSEMPDLDNNDGWLYLDRGEDME